jgi:hypothetical protein
MTMSAPRNLFHFAAILSVGLAFAGCGEASDPLEPTSEERSLLGGTLRIVGRMLPLSNTASEATIGPEGGTLSIPGGHSLHFPAGALDDSVTISAVVDPVKVMVDFGPEGLVFPDSAQPTLSLSYGSGLLGVLNPSSLVIVYVDEGVAVEVLPSVPDTQGNSVRAELEHFSTYVLATD